MISLQNKMGVTKIFTYGEMRWDNNNEDKWGDLEGDLECVLYTFITTNHKEQVN